MCAIQCAEPKQYHVNFPTDKLRMFPQSFEKDDDSNGHIDFISAAAVSC